ncbi:MAG: glutamate-1-semialdehyde 2,1-aminomutase [Bacteriovorax sp.]|nr:glutamate-1-semialdehyde 2,1-aminomutase [Bacteriovorax sp.]
MTSYSERLNKVIPGGAHTYSRGDDQFPANAPQILARGKGAYVWDDKGNKFLDYGMALRAITLGYSNDEVNRAAFAQAELGNNLTRASLIELEAAEKLVDLIPCAEMVKFAKNGSSVTSAAVKLARAFTGRKIIARCLQQPFFSYDDWFIGDTIIKRGVPSEISESTTNFNFNDIASVEALFNKFPNQIAAIILEPAATEEPKNNFLQDVKKLCEKNGTVFILDEMISGFRWHLQGAHTYYNVQPDLVTFGKAMANGYSVAALAGKKEIMDLGGIKTLGQERVFLMSSTHGAEMSSLGAFVASINIYERDNVISHLWSYGKKLKDGMNSISNEFGISQFLGFDGVDCSPGYFAKDKNAQVSLELRTLFSQEMIKNGVMIPWVALSTAHTSTELDMTLEAAKKAMKVYAMALEDGASKYLVGPAIKPVFRKVN